MEPKKVQKLDDESLNTVNGGFDDYNHCDWSPTELHEWEDYEIMPNVTGRRCKWCLLRLYPNIPKNLYTCW